MRAYSVLQLQSAAASRIYPATGPWERAVAWWRTIADLGYLMPLGLVADLGSLLAGVEVAADCGADAYAAFLRNAAATPAVRAARGLGLSDVALVALLAHVVHELPVSPQFALPPHTRPAEIAAELVAGLHMSNAEAQATYAQRRTDAQAQDEEETTPSELQRPEAPLSPLPAGLLDHFAALTLYRLCYSALHALTPSDVRFVAELGQVALGLTTLADLRALTELLRLPPLSHTLIEEVLAFLPALAEAQHSSAVQTYAVNGYGGIARSGWLDAALPSEWALPELLLNYRYLNGELLYYGRERPPEQRQTLLLMLMQMSDALAGDLEPLLKASALALARTGRARGAVVQVASFTTRLHAAQTLHGPAELAALVRQPCQGRVDLARVLSQVAARVRAESGHYQHIELFWLLHAEAGRDQRAAVAMLAQQLPRHLSRRALFVSAGPSVSEPILAASLSTRWASIGSAALYEPVARSQAAQALRALMRA